MQLKNLKYFPAKKVTKYYQASKEFKKKIQSERKKQHNNPGEKRMYF